MDKIKSLCIFTGSTLGNDGIYGLEAKKLAMLMVQNGISLVYGGGNRGLMGTIADTVSSNGGHVTGVLPEKMDIPSVRTKAVESKLIIVKDMHERKRTMYGLADAFLALPGGIGTLEELMEIFTWKQLKYHDKPVGLLNINGYYDTLLSFLDKMVTEGFLDKKIKESLIVVNNTEDVLERLSSMQEELPDKL